MSNERISRRSFVKTAAKGMLGAMGMALPAGVVAAKSREAGMFAPPMTGGAGGNVTQIIAADNADTIALDVQQLDATTSPGPPAIQITNNGDALDIYSTTDGYIGAGAFAFRTTNSSGATVGPGAVGYIAADGTFKTTTTAQDGRVWAVAVTDAANSASVFVARRGRVSVQVTGSASAGDYLVTSTTAGAAEAKSTIQNELFAVCLGSDSGGYVDALLLCGRQYQGVVPTQNLYRPATDVPPAQWTGTIATVGGSNVTYSTLTGAPKTMDANNSGGLTLALLLHNTTRGDSVLINDCNTGTSTITFKTTTPGTWQVGDSIQVNSLTNTSSTGNSLFMDAEIYDYTDIPDNSVVLWGIFNSLKDSSLTPGQTGTFFMHSYSVGVSAKRQVGRMSSTDPTYGDFHFIVPIYDNRVQLSWTNNNNTANLRGIYRLVGATVAVP